MRVPGRDFDAKPVPKVECHSCVSLTPEIFFVLCNATTLVFYCLAIIVCYIIYTSHDIKWICTGCNGLQGPHNVEGIHSESRR